MHRRYMTAGGPLIGPVLSQVCSREKRRTIALVRNGRESRFKDNLVRYSVCIPAYRRRTHLYAFARAVQRVLSANRRQKRSEILMTPATILRSNVQMSPGTCNSISASKIAARPPRLRLSFSLIFHSLRSTALAIPIIAQARPKTQTIAIAIISPMIEEGSDHVFSRTLKKESPPGRG
ncbi:hypothetical protein EV561_1522 [Rhizobium sp. BK376]|nr:hypothetical protein EV561_1522 [Rhizobium sp. BK376]